MSLNENKQINDMAAKNIEEQEMAQELMRMEMYEEGMRYDQMKQILQFINESRDMAGIEHENHSSQMVVSQLPEVQKSEVPVRNDSPIESNTKNRTLPKPSFSYRHQPDRVSPSVLSYKSLFDTSPTEEMSVSSPEMFQDERPCRKSSNMESESIFDKLVKENELEERNENIPQIQRNTSHTVSDSSQNSQCDEITLNDSIKSRRNERIERWKLDPTNIVVEANDVPLQEHKKSPALISERVPYNFFHNERIFEVQEKILFVLNYQLEETSRIWQRKRTLENFKLQWGSPIKVGANNSSLNKKPVLMDDPESPEKHENFQNNQNITVPRRNQERYCKRKAVDCIKDLVKDQSEIDDDFDDISEQSKKAKTSDRLWQPNTKLENVNSSEKPLTRSEKIFTNLNNKVEKPSYIIDYSSDEFDNDSLSCLHKKTKKNEEEENFVPRRIVPPNPAKSKLTRSSRSKKITPQSAVPRNKQTVLDKNNDGVFITAKVKNRNPFYQKDKNQTVISNNNDLNDELKNNNEIEENQCDVQINPKTIKGLANKLLYGTSLLLEKKKNEETLALAMTEDQLKLQEQQRIAKEELIKTRLQKREEEQKQRKDKDMEIRAKEKKYKQLEVVRDREQRKKRMQGKNRAERPNENVLVLTDDDDNDDKDNKDQIILSNDKSDQRITGLVQCPICFLEFSKDEIQKHAENCYEYDDVGSSHLPNENAVLDENSKIFVCDICSHFSTVNGIDYENHVSKCLRHAKGEMRSQTESDSSVVSIVEVPSSPVRCFVPISEQTESAINYAEQFVQEEVKLRRPRKRRLK